MFNSPVSKIEFSYYIKMILIQEYNYQETLQILRNKIKLIPIYEELKDWLKERFEIIVYNFIFEKIKYNNPENRYQLNILLALTNDFNKMLNYKNKKDKQEEISQKFYELATKYDYGNIETIKDVWICYNDFSAEIKADVNNQTYKHIGKHLEEKYNKYSLWRICTLFTTVTVFFQNEIDVQINKEKGICEKIRQDYLETLKKHDEFNVYNLNEFVMEFDSKENLDKNYNGNLYYYFK